MTVNVTGQTGLSSPSLVQPGPILSGQALRIGESIPNTFDPRVTGLVRPVGSRLFTRDGTITYVKTGSLSTDWALGSGVSAPLTLVVDDANTNLAPDILVLRKTTTGIAAVGLGATLAAELENDSNATKRAMTDVTTWTNAANGAEEALRTLSVMAAGVLTKLCGFGWMNTGTCAMIYVGDPGNQTGMRWEAGNLMRLLSGGSAWIQSQSGVTSLLTRTLLSAVRLSLAKGADVASATTLTLGADGNYFVITGATTINGITTANWQAGSKVCLELPSGITVTHNSGAPGGGAVAIKLRAAANLVTAAVTYLELWYNGTNWVQPS